MSEAGAPQPDEKRVSWAELFFDLVFVVAVTKVAALVASDHTWAGLLRAAVAFVPIYWTWVGTAIMTNLDDVSRAAVRLRVFVVALAGIFMALALDDAYGEEGLLFAAAYWGGRIVLGWPVLTRLRGGVPLTPYTVSMFATGPLLLLGALLPDNQRTVVWAIAALLDLASPSLLRRRLLGMHVDAGHLAERFGLFVLIALGESVVAIVTSVSDHLTVLDGMAVALAFAVTVGLWWVYFHFAADAVRHALATAAVQLDIARVVLSYGHLLFIGAVITVSVGLHDAVADPRHHLSWPATGLLYGGAALYLATFGLTRWAMFRLVSITRLSAAATVLAVLPVVPFLPSVASVALLALIVAGLNIVEWARNDRIGWRALLARPAE
ncbi:membrane protein [Actinoplanes cyaneus]|uniref:Membrane protein n=1 Tax=Actinoplanes cyaneus TaxID=52696 RepID=A0A919IMD8_9ACTN|nr:low temperature requirement protein A [Actinoplanes cyaneus]MCW2139990.1 Low temperature requirement protein LtrA [Actinoplanes cyaneus]GID67711.1 membrane protein [Actinoplanes cyaneus]